MSLRKCYTCGVVVSDPPDYSGKGQAVFPGSFICMNCLDKKLRVSVCERSEVIDNTWEKLKEEAFASEKRGKTLTCKGCGYTRPQPYFNGKDWVCAECYNLGPRGSLPTLTDNLRNAISGEDCERIITEILQAEMQKLMGNLQDHITSILSANFVHDLLQVEIRAALRKSL